MTFIPDKPTSTFTSDKTTSTFVSDRPTSTFTLDEDKKKESLFKTVIEADPLWEVKKQFAIGAVDEALLGFPLGILKKVRSKKTVEELTSETKTGRIARGAGRVFGFLGLPAKTFTEGAKIGVRALQMYKEGQEIGRFAKAAAAAGGAFGLFELVKAPNERVREKFLTVPIATTIGAGLGVAGEALKPVVKKGVDSLINKFFKKTPKPTEIIQTTSQVTDNIVAKTNSIRADISNKIKVNNLSAAQNLINSELQGVEQISAQSELNLAKIRGVGTPIKRINDLIKHGLYNDAQYIVNNELKGIEQVLQQNKINVAKLQPVNMSNIIVEQVKNIVPDEEIPKQVLKEVSVIKSKNIFNNELTVSDRVYLQGQGNGGIALTDKIDAITDKGERRAGTAIADYMKVRKGLNSEELSNFVDVVKGKALPLNNRVQNLTDFWVAKREQIAKEAIELKLDVKSIKNSRGQKIPEISLFKPTENYFPQLVISVDSSTQVVEETLNAAVKRGDFKSIDTARRAWKSYADFVNSGKKSEAILQYFVDSGQTQTKAEAEKLLSTWIRRGRMRRFGNLERARDINLPFWDTNPNKVLTKYFSGAYHRLEEVRNLGSRDEIAKSLINQIREEGGDWLNAQTMFDRWSGKEFTRPAFGVIGEQTAQKIRSFESITKLGLSAIPNSTQSINTAFTTNLKSTGRAIKKALTEEGQDFAMRTGAVLDSTIDTVINQSTGGITGGARRFLKYVGFSGTERMNRIIAANAGREYAIQMSEKLLSNPADKFATRALKELNLNPALILKRGSITFDELLIAGQRIVNKTQFRSGVLDLPLFYTSPEGRIVTQFKNFAFNQMKLMKDAIWLEVRKGNFRPLITAVTLMPILGEGVKDVRSILTGKSRDGVGLERIIDNMSAIGSLGILKDIYSSATIGKTTEFMAGPAISDIAAGITGVVQTTKGKPQTLGRTALRQIPVFGQLISRQILPTKKEQKNNFMELKELNF